MQKTIVVAAQALISKQIKHCLQDSKLSIKKKF